MRAVLSAARLAGEPGQYREGLQALKLHVSALQGPLVALLQQHGCRPAA